MEDKEIEKIKKELKTLKKSVGHSKKSKSSGGSIFKKLMYKKVDVRAPLSQSEVMKKRISEYEQKQKSIKLKEKYREIEKQRNRDYLRRTI
jgi:hypothetical protein